MPALKSCLQDSRIRGSNDTPDCSPAVTWVGATWDNPGLNWFLPSEMEKCESQVLALEPRWPAPCNWLIPGLDIFHSPLSLFAYLWRAEYDALGHGSNGKESACKAGDPGSIPGSGKSPGEGNGYPAQYSCLENPMDRGAWRATYSPWSPKQSETTELLTLFTYLILIWYFNFFLLV